MFCLSADDNSDLPPLTKGRSWTSYLLTAAEWDLLKQAYHCLQVTSSFSSTKFD
jgi:hypothetical protein